MRVHRRRLALAVVSLGSLVAVGGLGLAAGLQWTMAWAASPNRLGPVPACESGVLHLGGPWGTAVVNVEVADTDEERARGLMFREDLAAGSGMLFVYPEATSVAFWMKNTLIPLDMLFFDARGDLRHVHYSAVPLDETLIPGGRGIKAVLEVEAGEVARTGIGPRTTMRHPSLDQGVARWACSSL